MKGDKKMERIRNNRDLKRAYESLFIYNEISNEYGETDLLKTCIKDQKRKIRAYIHKPTDRRLIKDNGIDGYVEKILLPNTLRTKKDAVSYFEEEEYMTCIPSQYDCTGQRFTCWYRIAEQNGRFYAYHCVGADV